MSFVRNIGAMAISSLLAQAVLIGSGIIAARGLGPEDRGHLALLMLAPIIVAQLAQMGLPVALNYYVAADGGLADASRRPLLIQALMRLALALLMFAVTVGVAQPQMPPRLLLPGALMAFAVVGLITQEYSYAVLQGLDRFRQVAVARLVPAASYSLMACGLWLADQVTLLALCIAWACSYLLSALVALLLVMHGGVPEPRGGETRSPADFRRFGLRAFIGSASPMETFRIDQILGATLLGPAALGLYVVAQSFSTLPRIVASNSGFVIYADAASRARDGRAGLRALLVRVAKLSAVNAGFCLLLAAVLPWLNPLFFGAEFTAATAASQWLVLAAWIGATRKFLGELAKGLGQPLIQTWCELLVLLALPLLAWLGVRDGRPESLALALVAAQAIVGLVCMALLLRLLRGTADGVRRDAINTVAADGR
ncbi:MAG: oligosaccharide flippase family protein [Gammaproteobacteria bacterium]|nr:oligosaccharide flippase family protein [Gammaproteobacteria bacterium]